MLPQLTAYIKKYAGWLLIGMATIFAVVKGLQPVACLGISSLLIFVAAVSPLLLTILLDKTVKVNSLLISLLFVCMISLLDQPAASPFHAWERLGYFSVMLGLLSPLLQNKLFGKIRGIAWQTMMWAFRAIVFCSFILYIGRSLNLAPFQDIRLMGFKGVTPGGMALAPICAIVIIDLLWRCCRPSSGAKWHRIAYAISAYLIFMMMVQAGSRITLVGVIIAAGWFIYQVRHTIARYLRRPAYLIAGGVMLLVMVGAAALASDTMLRKFTYAAQNHSVTYSRDGKWDGRIEEWLSSPITGIGYTTQTSFNAPSDNLHYINTTGMTEPGSSWLAVLAQTGLAGFVLLLCFNINLWRICWRQYRHGTHRPEMTLYIPLLLFLWINGVAEGWILYPGGFMFFPYWLMSGLIYYTNTTSVTKV